MCGGQRVTCGSQFSLPTMWILGVKFWSSGLGVRSLTHWATSPPIGFEIWIHVLMGGRRRRGKEEEGRREKKKGEERGEEDRGEGRRSRRKRRRKRKHRHRCRCRSRSSRGKEPTSHKQGRQTWNQRSRFTELAGVVWGWRKQAKDFQVQNEFWKDVYKYCNFQC